MSHFQICSVCMVNTPENRSPAGGGNRRQVSGLQQEPGAGQPGKGAGFDKIRIDTQTGRAIEFAIWQCNGKAFE